MRAAGLCVLRDEPTGSRARGHRVGKRLQDGRRCPRPRRRGREPVAEPPDRAARAGIDRGVDLDPPGEAGQRAGRAVHEKPLARRRRARWPASGRGTARSGRWHSGRSRRRTRGRCGRAPRRARRASRRRGARSPLPAAIATGPAAAPWSCISPPSGEPRVMSGVTTFGAGVKLSSKTRPSRSSPPFCGVERHLVAVALDDPHRDDRRDAVDRSGCARPAAPVTSTPLGASVAIFLLMSSMACSASLTRSTCRAISASASVRSRTFSSATRLIAAARVFAAVTASVELGRRLRRGGRRHQRRLQRRRQRRERIVARRARPPPP